MSAVSARTSAVTGRRRGRARGTAQPARRPRPSLHVLGGSLMVLVGSFLPWVSTGLGNVSGIRGAGLWTLYASCLGIAAAIVRYRRIAASHAAVLGLVAVTLPVWQLVHTYSLVGTTGWMPGPGLLMVFGGGVVALVAATRLWRGER